MSLISVIATIVRLSGVAAVSIITGTGEYEVHGTSITAGSSASPGQSMHELIATAKGWTLNNKGQGGYALGPGTTSYGIADKTSIEPYAAGKVALGLHYGPNDVGRVGNGTFTADSFGRRLSEWVDYAINVRGWPAGRIIIFSPDAVSQTGYNLYVGLDGCLYAADSAIEASFVDAAHNVALTRHTCWVNINAALRAQPNWEALLADGLHPNNGGHAVDAATTLANDFIALFFIPLVVIRRRKTIDIPAPHRKAA